MSGDLSEWAEKRRRKQEAAEKASAQLSQFRTKYNPHIDPAQLHDTIMSQQATRPNTSFQFAPSPAAPRGHDNRLAPPKLAHQGSSQQPPSMTDHMLDDLYPDEAPDIHEEGQEEYNPRRSLSSAAASAPEIGRQTPSHIAAMLPKKQAVVSGASQATRDAMVLQSVERQAMDDARARREVKAAEMRELVKMKEMADDAAANVNHVKDEAQNFKLRAAIEKRELSHTVEGQKRELLSLREKLIASQTVEGTDLLRAFNEEMEKSLDTMQAVAKEYIDEMDRAQKDYHAQMTKARAEYEKEFQGLKRAHMDEVHAANQLANQNVEQTKRVAASCLIDIQTAQLEFIGDMEEQKGDLWESGRQARLLEQLETSLAKKQSMLDDKANVQGTAGFYQFVRWLVDGAFIGDYMWKREMSDIDDEIQNIREVMQRKLMRPKDERDLIFSIATNRVERKRGTTLARLVFPLMLLTLAIVVAYITTSNSSQYEMWSASDAHNPYLAQQSMMRAQQHEETQPQVYTSQPLDFHPSPQTGNEAESRPLLFSPTAGPKDSETDKLQKSLGLPTSKDKSSPILLRGRR